MVVKPRLPLRTASSTIRSAGTSADDTTSTKSSSGSSRSSGSTERAEGLLGQPGERGQPGVDEDVGLAVQLGQGGGGRDLDGSGHRRSSSSVDGGGSTTPGDGRVPGGYARVARSRSSPSTGSTSGMKA